MKLQTSKLCVNCESLYEQSAPCPYCGSEIFMWLSRALGTTLEANLEDMEICGDPLRESPTSQAFIHPSSSPVKALGSLVTAYKSFMEVCLACSRMGREMVRVLTFGLV